MNDNQSTPEAPDATTDTEPQPQLQFAAIRVDPLTNETIVSTEEDWNYGTTELVADTLGAEVDARAAPPPAAFPSWWDAQVETLLNGTEDRRSREVRDARRAKRARICRLLIWIAVAVVAVEFAAASEAFGMLEDVPVSLGGLLTEFLARIGLT
ncbi:hypothetical protein C5E06_10045 [Pseudoclavibacter sp. RFBI5]|uniref:hypothetical protein n=1 Tax=Pseudoclavibacter sp. RFBI5 TaxID=2080578 RepID=UPI000CE79FD8|nr:hypothetical protein [Pseudoclavibacter sp. RFBI5]PPG02782.1 hypothetical protein C5E06_10045 [Pseudoclavibacter sp. RFBI5]